MIEYTPIDVGTHTHTSSLTNGIKKIKEGGNVTCEFAREKIDRKHTPKEHTDTHSEDLKRGKNSNNNNGIRSQIGFQDNWVKLVTFKCNWTAWE